MASSIKLYTIGSYMKNAICHYATSEATGFEKENAHDNNPDTYWKPTGVSPSTLNYDLGTAYAPDVAVLCVQNNVALTTPVSAYIQYSDNESDWTADSNLITFGGHAYQFRYIEVAEATPHRYWRLLYASAAVAPHISGLWLCKEFDLGQGNEYPENNGGRFYNRVTLAAGGRQYTSAINQNEVSNRSRTFHFPNTTNYNALYNAWQDCGGRRWPLFISETNGGTFEMVHFVSDDFNSVTKSYQVYNPSVSFVGAPIIASGESY